jgi:hypothetical protein
LKGFSILRNSQRFLCGRSSVTESLRPPFLLDRDAEGEAAVLRALDDPGGHGRSPL